MGKGLQGGGWASGGCAGGPLVASIGADDEEAVVEVEEGPS